VHVLNLAAINAQGRSDLFLRLEIIKQVASITLVLIFAQWGPLAIAWSVLLSGIFSAGLNTYYSKRLLGYGWLGQLADQWPTLALSAVAAALGWAVMHWSRPGPLAMVAAIIVSATVYLILAALTRSAALRALLSIFQALRSRRPADIS
jgi:hypothetical protein